MANRHLLCALLVTLGQSIVVWKWYFPSLRRRLTAQMAALLPLFFIAPMVLLFQHYGGGGTAQASGQPNNPTPVPEGADDPAATGTGGDHDGVILWAEEEKHTILIPPMPALKSEALRSSSEPLSVPFYGVYWMYRAPHRQPPANSLITRGSPDKMSFLSTDGFPLIMEAHQNFGKHLPIHCCQAIQLSVSVSSEEKAPEFILLELILIDSRTKQTVSLGRVSSTADPSKGLLTFPMPAQPAFREFDEVEIRYHLPYRHHTRSARIAIKRFIFVPRGATL